ncbi:M20 metallopeptidase family protein [Pseudoleptotrichia goodfellowii]|uniref:Amidohydrolase n=1 Tax=Pseudoleptotrichia goodfellowii F0264 TaxID=596323 RepID=D0GLG5_9FUSO|nr:M20 family metallopeptidase [Pseudoleptotrichia goodfellowii]EEY35062.1 amidohydrolase [Pseudoleptotrichia goodfellowii F0264]
MNSKEINDFIKQNTGKIYDEIVKIRRKIHMNPELGDEEFETGKTIKDFLKENGIEYEEVINTGVVATIYNGEGKTVATRADIDALPIFEENDVEYKSKIDGKMHACGHDGHTSVQLGVAKILADNKDKWKGTVRFFFQPAEETNGGADRMIKAGTLKFKGDENRKIDAFFALHMAPEIETGKIGIKYGKAHATSAMFRLTINGVSAHAAQPQKGVDAILIGAKVLEFLQSIVSRRIDPREEAVITVGSFKGGEAENVVCDKVDMLGTIRTMSKEIRTFIIETIKRDLPKFVESLGGKADIRIREGYAPVINNEEITKKVEQNIIDLYGKESLEIIKEARMDVEDVSYFLNEINGCFFRLGTRNEEKGLIYDLHHPKFNIDEESLKIGIGLQLKNILEFLK